VAFQIIAADNAQMQRDLTMGTSILQRENFAAAAAIQNDGIAREAPS